MCQICYDGNYSKIGNPIIKDADVAHSSYMRREIIDEVHPVIDDISEILDIISKMRKQLFSTSDFKRSFEEYARTSRRKDDGLNYESVLQLLYFYNVIGNFSKSRHKVFAYSSESKTVNLGEVICVHVGLLKALSII